MSTTTDIDGSVLALGTTAIHRVSTLSYIVVSILVDSDTIHNHLTLELLIICAVCCKSVFILQAFPHLYRRILTIITHGDSCNAHFRGKYLSFQIPTPVSDQPWLTPIDSWLPLHAQRRGRYYLPLWIYRSLIIGSRFDYCGTMVVNRNSR